MNAALLYVAQSAVWGACGFVGGFLAGRAAKDVHTLAQTADRGDTVDEQASPPRRRRPRAEWVLGIVVLLLAILTVAQGIVESTATRRVVQCQTTYSNAFSDALDARTQASTQAQDALDQLVTAIATVNGTPAVRAAAVQKAISDYLATRAHLKQQQAAHPYPPAPRDLCP